MLAVSTLQSATYKEVANMITGHATTPYRFALDQQAKNMRRRVYDSLNVLYAVGVLGKNHR